MKLPMIKQYPRDLIVGESEWTVKFTRDIQHMGSDCLGLCDPADNTIYIRQKQNKMQTLLTLIHECIHAMENEYDFYLGEANVLKLERAIADFILVNSPIFTARNQ